jgi:hypothetical protein
MARRLRHAGSGKRNYRKEYENYQSKPEVKKQRAENNKANRLMKAAGKIKKGDGNVVAHKDNNTSNNKKSNLKVVKRKTNASFPRTKTARRKKS